jgi:hypothetical protein
MHFGNKKEKVELVELKENETLALWINSWSCCRGLYSALHRIRQEWATQGVIVRLSIVPNAQPPHRRGSLGEERPALLTDLPHIHKGPLRVISGFAGLQERHIRGWQQRHVRLFLELPNSERGSPLLSGVAAPHGRKIALTVQLHLRLELVEEGEAVLPLTAFGARRQRARNASNIRPDSVPLHLPQDHHRLLPLPGPHALPKKVRVVGTVERKALVPRGVPKFHGVEPVGPCLRQQFLLKGIYVAKLVHPATPESRHNASATYWRAHYALR